MNAQAQHDLQADTRNPYSCKPPVELASLIVVCFGQGFFPPSKEAEIKRNLRNAALEFAGFKARCTMWTRTALNYSNDRDWLEAHNWFRDLLHSVVSYSGNVEDTIRMTAGILERKKSENQKKSDKLAKKRSRKASKK